MANEGRYLNKRFALGDGLQGSHPSAAIVEEGGVWSLVGGVDIGGVGTKATRLTSVLASIDFAQIEPSGSTGAKTVNVTLTGVAPGDQCWASPVQSVPDNIVWAAACYSAGVVNVRAIHTGSGAIDLAATNWRVSAMRFG